ncbi:substrate-binding domain-containing protein, partial [Escherichia coli]
EGLGVAFLPFSAVRDDLQSGHLVSAALADGPQFSLPMNLLAYREKPNPNNKESRAVHALWHFLQEQAAGLPLAG